MYPPNLLVGISLVKQINNASTNLVHRSRYTNTIPRINYPIFSLVSFCCSKCHINPSNCYEAYLWFCRQSGLTITLTQRKSICFCLENLLCTCAAAAIVGNAISACPLTLILFTCKIEPTINKMYYNMINNRCKKHTSIQQVQTYHL